MGFNKYEVRKKQHRLTRQGIRLWKKTITTCFQVLLATFVLLVVIMAGAGFGMIKGVLDDSPDISSVNIKPRGFQTKFFNEQGEETDTLSTINSNRVYVTLDKVPDNVINAYVSIEDQRFWKHNGVDLRAFLRAAFRGIANGFNFHEGGSTLTQQLIKNQVFDVGMNEKTFMDSLKRKIQEQYLAVELEKVYTKEQIIEYYINTIYLGQGCSGVEAASQRYFGKSISDVTLSEAAVIAGITQNPYGYDPILYPSNNANRREDVLDKMLELGYITQAQYDEAMADDVYARIAEVKEVRDENASYNTYYTDAIIDSLKKDFMEMYDLSSEDAIYEIYNGGYSVYSVQDYDIQEICDSVVNDESYFGEATSVSLSYALTLTDSKKEEHNYGINDLMRYYRGITGNPKYNSIYPSEETARAAADEYLDYLLDTTGYTFKAESFSVSIQPQVTFVIMDQHTGYIKAVVGGRGEKTGDRGWNRATDSNRQPGSTFKVLAAFLPYIDQGGCLASAFDDAPYEFAGGGSVVNWYHSYRGYSNIRQAIANSMNIIAVKAITEVTPEVAYEYLINLGFTSLVDDQEPRSDGLRYTDKTQSAALGGLTYGVSNVEITAAYAAIANGGVYTKPVYYSKVIDHDGNVIIDNTKTEENQHVAMKATTAWQLIQGMRDVVTSGTGTAARMDYGVMCAGKTGTTSSNYDVWFCGMTPYYTASIWMGYDNNVNMGSTTTHKKVWKAIMDKIAEMEQQDTSAIIMEKPEGITSITVCQITGLIPQEGCPTFTDYGAVGAGPSKKCEGHETITVCLDSNEIATSQCTNIASYVVILDEDGNRTINDCPFAYTEALFTSSCHLHPEPADMPTISTSAGEGGTISGSVQVAPGSEVKISIAPYSGYVIADVLVDGVSVGARTEYTFVNVLESHTVSAVFMSTSPTPSTEAPTEAPPETPTE